MVPCSVHNEVSFCSSDISSSNSLMKLLCVRPRPDRRYCRRMCYD
ncbi:hypothetical protein T265_12311 [Opisthorchis viverrini]|uniref:Uncharacterized protein n=1 Tax=Opisthorchis viverrini TaxID=6198 RepID=A0A074ZSS3_OPIVI|nr:hypothetical protein T265_12311 [Opisthorchis viverrini]KER18319.1 hypothetical protein T265_12311 [Opisthorchis viverrini]